LREREKGMVWERERERKKERERYKERGREREGGRVRKEGKAHLSHSSSFSLSLSPSLSPSLCLSLSAAYYRYLQPEHFLLPSSLPVVAACHCKSGSDIPGSANILQDEPHVIIGEKAEYNQG
jgi:hypothetical protein